MAINRVIFKTTIADAKVYSTTLKVKKTDVVTVCLFRIFTFNQIILNPVTVAKHLVVLTALEYSCVVIFAKSLIASNILQRALY